MGKYQKIFERKELKYLITYQQWADLLRIMNNYLEIDQYGKHLISNIYYDTDSWYLARHSMSKPTYKEKVRVRSYGIAKKDGDVFLELKKKYKGIVYKRRTSMSLLQTEQFLNHKNYAVIEEPNQIIQEFQYVLDYYPDLKPAIYISYERQAYVGKENPDIRVTFDEEILYRTDDLSLSKGSYGVAILPEGKLLMEIKICGGMPLWLVNSLSKLEIYPAKFSKLSNSYLDQQQKQIAKEGCVA